MLDLLYANATDAYSSTALPPLGRSDHNLVYFQSMYLPAVQQQPVTTKMVRRWTPDAVETLQGCLEVTDWGVFCDVYREYINSLTDCITGYVNFCTYNIIPTKTVHFPKQ